MLFRSAAAAFEDSCDQLINHPKSFLSPAPLIHQENPDWDSTCLEVLGSHEVAWNAVRNLKKFLSSTVCPKSLELRPAWKGLEGFQVGMVLPGILFTDQF